MADQVAKVGDFYACLACGRGVSLVKQGSHSYIFVSLQGVIDNGTRIVVQGEQELMLSSCGQLMEKRELRV
jgi:predicted metal-binding protein